MLSTAVVVAAGKAERTDVMIGVPYLQLRLSVMACSSMSCWERCGGSSTATGTCSGTRSGIRGVCFGVLAVDRFSA